MRREFTHFRRMLYADPNTAHLLLDKLTEVAISYLRMQVDAGVEAVQLFDTWIGQLSQAQFERIALPGLERIFSELNQLQVFTIYFANDSAHLLPLLPRTAADVFSIDWRTDLRTGPRSVRPLKAAAGQPRPCRPVRTEGSGGGCHQGNCWTGRGEHHISSTLATAFIPRRQLIRCGQ